MKLLSTRTHTIIGIIFGLALIAAPWLFGFSDTGGAAMLVPIYVGIFILLSELVTTNPYSLVKLVPMYVHVVLDVLTGAFLLISPWVFGFANSDTNTWLPHLVVGALVVGYALFTRVTYSELTLKY